VRLDHVDDPHQAVLDKELEAVAAHEQVPRRTLVGEGELDAAAPAAQSDRCVGVQAAGRLVCALEDLVRPQSEFERHDRRVRERVGRALGGTIGPTEDNAAG
jgi:hypothetical protein